MSLEEIERRIKQEEKEKVHKLLSNAKKTYYTVMAASAKRVEKVRLEWTVRTKTEVNALLDTEINAAKAEAEKRYNAAFSTVMEDTLHMVPSALAAFVKTSAYKRLLSKLAKKASAELGEDAVFYVTKADLEWVKKEYPKLNILAAKDAFVGGVRAVSKDGFTGIDFSLEYIIRRNKDAFTSELSQHMLRGVSA